jgi:hypothetical protein
MLGVRSGSSESCSSWPSKNQRWVPHRPDPCRLLKVATLPNSSLVTAAVIHPDIINE